MSFFDEVETTVANTRFLQAISDHDPIHLNLKAFDELHALSERHKGTITIDQCMQSQTIINYLFKQYLLTQQHEDTVHLLTGIECYAKKCSSTRVKILGQILSFHPVLVGKSVDDEKATASTSIHTSTIHVEQKKSSTQHKIDFEYIMSTPPCSHNICHQLASDAKEEIATIQSHTTTVPLDLFTPLLNKIKIILQEHLPSFLNSIHYQRYIQLLDYSTRPVHLIDFRIFRVLGRGAFGAVSAVQKLDTHAVFAMKEMGKKQVKQDASEWMVVNEKKILAQMNSPFVLGLNYSFHEDDTLYLVFSMCAGGDLKFHLRAAKDKCFSPARSKFYAAEVLLGLEHIHSLDVVYRDLKPNNILLDQNGHVKISDLGLSIKLKKNKVLKHLAGTAGYWAPEIVMKTGTFLVSDYWSFGTFLYEMLTGKRPACTCSKKTKEWCPFGQKRSMEDNAVDPEGILKLEIDYSHAAISPQCKDMLQKLFHVDPKQRLGANGIGEIKSHPYFQDIDWEAMACLEVTPPFVPDQRTVNANSIGEVGEFNKTQFKNIQLNVSDEKYYEEFVFTSHQGVEQELLEAITKIDYPQANGGSGNKSGDSTSSCCVIL